MIRIHTSHAHPAEIDALKACGKWADNLIEIEERSDCYRAIMRQRANRRTKEVVELRDTVAVPREKWPLAVKAIARLAMDQDAGIGDTIHRLMGSGGEIFERMFKQIAGRDCGCQNRRAILNRMYPLIRSITYVGPTGA
jgi:hypothetical protein